MNDEIKMTKSHDNVTGKDKGKRKPYDLEERTASFDLLEDIPQSGYRDYQGQTNIKHSMPSTETRLDIRLA